MSQISGNVLPLSEAREPPMTSSPSHYYWRLPHYTRSKTTIVIIGTGPRGIAVLEVIATKLIQDANGPQVRILLVDSSELGAGRIWRTDQEPWFLMNTVIGEISMFPALMTEERAGRARAARSCSGSTGRTIRNCPNLDTTTTPPVLPTADTSSTCTRAS
ncbi:MAG: FAD/NAD(P)-binding protein [Pseudonocardiaceae bacterium]